MHFTLGFRACQMYFDSHNIFMIHQIYPSLMLAVSICVSAKVEESQNLLEMHFLVPQRSRYTCLASIGVSMYDWKWTRSSGSAANVRKFILRLKHAYRAATCPDFQKTHFCTQCHQFHDQKLWIVFELETQCTSIRNIERTLYTELQLLSRVQIFFASTIETERCKIL